MRTENYTHRGYEIQITHNPPIWQAAIYASNLTCRPSIGPMNPSLPPASTRRLRKQSAELTQYYQTFRLQPTINRPLPVADL
jgi:hypothetical protein